MKAFGNRFTIFILFLTFYSLVNGQEEIDFKQLFVEAESYFLFEEYRDALPIYQRLLREDPENLNLKYKIGVCYLNDSYQKEKSIQYLLDASNGIDENYKSNNHKERMAPPEVHFYLAQAYRVNGDLKKALEYYSIFKNELDPEIFDANIVIEEIEACNQAVKLKKSPVYYKKQNAENIINSRFAEINPVISGDGNTIIFNRKLQFYDAVFISTKEMKGHWSAPINLTPDFGLDGNSYCTGISFNGNEIFVYRSDNYDGNIYSSTKKDGRWQKLQKLNESINTKYWESHATPSPDGKYLYFTSNRRGGYGGLDIYKAPRAAGNSWGEPINLGPVVNSPYNEETPFVSPENQQLFFSSMGHKGMGGYDIFVSELIAPETWSTPVNLGYPINTTDDDMFFCPSPGETHTAVYAAYDPESSLGLKDIYYVTIYNSILPRKFSVSGRVNVPSPDFLENGGVRVSIIDNATGRLIDQVNIDTAGEFLLTVSQGDYQLLVDGDGIKPVSFPVTLALNQENDQVEMPVITAQLSAIGEDKLLSTPSELPELSVEGPDFISIDTVPVTINLKVKRGDDLIVELFLDNELIKREEYRITKDNFVYKFSPEEGLNKIIFTLRDKDGNINQQEVNVLFQPKKTTEPLATEGELKELPMKFDEFAEISGKELRNYIMSLENLDYTSLSELYNALNSNAEANGYSVNDIQELFAVLLTQRDKNEFTSELSAHFNLNELNDGKGIGQNADLPLLIVSELKKSNIERGQNIDLELLKLVPVEFIEDELFRYILSFSDSANINMNAGADIDNNHLIQSRLISQLGTEHSSEIINKAVTTRELNQYFNNLLMSSGAELKSILSEIEFTTLAIDNAIDLVEYLFHQANMGKIEHYLLVEELEQALKEENRNILLFREALAEIATGELKTDIQELQLFNESNNGELITILESLLKNTRTKGYSKAEIYDLILTMIGIEDVDDFILEMLKYTSGDMDSLLVNADRKKFSTPLEIIQYLLSESNYFNYTETDINNLLMRMLLENGFEGKGMLKDSVYTQELIKKKRLITTIVLVNILLIIIVLLFWRRKRKKK